MTLLTIDSNTLSNVVLTQNGTGDLTLAIRKVQPDFSMVISTEYTTTYTRRFVDFSEGRMFSGYIKSTDAARFTNACDSLSPLTLSNRIINSKNYKELQSSMGSGPVNIVIKGASNFTNHLAKNDLLAKNDMVGFKLYLEDTTKGAKVDEMPAGTFGLQVAYIEVSFSQAVGGGTQLVKVNDFAEFGHILLNGHSLYGGVTGTFAG